MSQTWNDNTFEGGHVAQTDLQNMENNFACLKSCFSGAAAPANTVAGLQWFDTAKLVTKTRNNADDAWLGLMHGDVSEKRLVYRNAAMDGYARDATVTDRAIALKGGAIYITGGAVAGTVGIPSHVLSLAELPAHTHGASAHAHDVEGSNAGGTTWRLTYTTSGHDTSTAAIADAAISKAHTHTSVGSGNAHDHGGTGYRVSAAVCILIYLDL